MDYQVFIKIVVLSRGLWR